MRDLPRKAQSYILLVVMLGLGSALAAWCTVGPKGHSDPLDLFVFLMLAILAGSKKIVLLRHKGMEDAGSMSLGFVITFAAMLRFGPFGGWLVETAGSLSSCLFPKRQRWHQLLFNVALTSVEAWSAGMVFLALNRWSLALRPLETFPAIVASTLTYFVINTGGVAIIIGLCSEQKPFHVWKQAFMWTAPSYFAGACVSTLAMILFGRHAAAIILFLSPVAYLTYQSYAVYTSRAEEKQRHIEELQAGKEQLADLYLATIKSLALAIDAKDQYTHQHILRVQRYAVATAKKMGITGVELEGINTGALLHDTGKLGVPEYVLLKPGRLTDEEFAKIKKHPEIGAAILDPVAFPWPVLPVVKYHHEKWDGTGYPEGLKGEDIPLLARVLAVADVYDALTSSRSYRTAWTHEKACGVIKKDSGTHFDPAIVEVFLQIIDGVVAEMAEEGVGPLVANPISAAPLASISKSDQAARDIQRASSELWAMYEVAQTLSSSLGLTETLDILARKLEAIMPGTACLFLLKDDSALTTRAAVGVNREYFQNSRSLSHASLSLRVVETQESYLGEYDADDLMLTSSESAQWVPLQTALIVPITHQGSVLGTINLYHPCAEAFSAHDKQLLETISERAAMALYNGILFERTRSHAMEDSLTGLYNARYLAEYMVSRCDIPSPEADSGALSLSNSAHQNDPEQPFAILCIDLDSFKPINDNFGHQKGDQVLKELAAKFREIIGASGIVARYGGDEFVIVLNEAGEREAQDRTRQIAEAVEMYNPGLVHPKLGALRLGASIGYACYPPDGRDFTTLLSAADSNMYLMKTERKLGRMAAAPKSANAMYLESGLPFQDAA